MLDPKKNKGLDFLDDDEEPSRSGPIKTNLREGKDYEIFFPEDVGAVSEFSDILDLLLSSTDKDTITFFMANYGGDCHTLMYLVNVIRQAKAPVKMKVLAPCYSAGAMLSLAGTSLEMMPNTFLMFHQYSSFSYGKGKELITGAMEKDKWLASGFDNICHPFLSKQEIKKIRDDKDLYIHWNDKDLKDRIQRHFGEI